MKTKGFTNLETCNLNEQNNIWILLNINICSNIYYYIIIIIPTNYIYTYLRASISFKINISFIIDKIGFNAIHIKIDELNLCRHLNWRGWQNIPGCTASECAVAGFLSSAPLLHQFCMKVNTLHPRFALKDTEF
jgi:hypothetical protein